MEVDPKLFGCDDAYYNTYGVLYLFRKGKFIGPPIRYEGGDCLELPLDADRLNLFMLHNLVKTNGFPKISLGDIYYKSVIDGFEELTSLADDDSVREILEIVRSEDKIELYVDSFSNLAGLLDPLMHPPAPEGNGLAGDNVEGNLNIEVNEVNGGRCVNNGKGDGSNVIDVDPLSESESTPDLETPLNSDAEDEEVLEIRRIRKQRRETRFNEEGPENQTESITATASEVRQSEGEVTGPRTGEIHPEQAHSSAVRKKSNYSAVKRSYRTLDVNLQHIPERPAPPGDPVSSFQQIPTDSDDHSISDDAESSERENEYTDSDDAAILSRFVRDEEVEDDPFYYTDLEASSVVETDEYYNPDCEEVQFKVGLRFKDHVQFREACRRHGVEKRADLIHVFNDRRRQRFDCSGRCPFTVRASKDSRDESFRIKRLCKVHKYGFCLQ